MEQAQRKRRNEERGEGRYVELIVQDEPRMKDLSPRILPYIWLENVFKFSGRCLCPLRCFSDAETGGSKEGCLELMVG